MAAAARKKRVGAVPAPAAPAPEPPAGTIGFRDEGQGPEPPHPLWWLVPALTLVLCMVLFNLGHSAIDRPEPDTGAAGTFYAAALLVGVSGLAAAVALRSPSAPVLVLGALLFGGLWALLAFESTEDYNEGSGSLFTFLPLFAFWPFLLFVVVLAALAVALIVLRPHYTLRALGGALLSGAMAYSWLALAHLTQLDHQADLARAAYEERNTPGLALLATLLALAVSLAWARRLRR